MYKEKGLQGNVKREMGKERNVKRFDVDDEKEG